jgi:hypothetical protein
MMEINFGGGAITKDTWADIEEIILANNLESVLEIGAGSSTLLFSKVAKEVVSLETDKRWIAKLEEEKPSNIQLIHYVYPKLPQDLDGCWDVVFVDGPAGSKDHREASMLFARLRTDLVLIHDSYRKGELVAIGNVFPADRWTLKRKRGGLMVAARNGAGIMYDI